MQDPSMRAGACWVVGQRIDTVQTATDAGRACLTTVREGVSDFWIYLGV